MAWFWQKNKIHASLESLKATIRKYRNESVTNHEQHIQTLFGLREMWKHLTFTLGVPPARALLGYCLSELMYKWARSHPGTDLASSERLLDRPEFCNRIGSGVSEIEALLGEIGDPVLSDLWNMGTWKALHALLSQNMVRAHNPCALLWNSPGYGAALEREKQSKSSTTPLSPDDLELIKTAARAFPELQPMTSPGLFVQRESVLEFNPLAHTWQAERLAEVMRINVLPMGRVAWRAVCGGFEHHDAVALIEDCGGDTEAARRRAVVLAAVQLLTRPVDEEFNPSRP